jgi:hypothetical protein
VPGEVVAALERRFDVDGRAARAGQRLGRVDRFDRTQQRLARHARPVRALAADEFLLHDDRAAVAVLDGVLGGVLPGRTAADDDHVPGFAITHGIASLREAMPTTGAPRSARRSRLLPMVRSLRSLTSKNATVPRQHAGVP